jgi:hypothetical protein
VSTARDARRIAHGAPELERSPVERLCLVEGALLAGALAIVAGGGDADVVADALAEGKALAIARDGCRQVVVQQRDTRDVQRARG